MNHDPRKHTPMFPSTIRPVRNGVYRRDVYGLWLWALFRNGVWFTGSSSYKMAASEYHPSAYQTGAKWFGLKKKAKK